MGPAGRILNWFVCSSCPPQCRQLMARILSDSYETHAVKKMFFWCAKVCQTSSIRCGMYSTCAKFWMPSFEDDGHAGMYTGSDKAI